MHKINTIIYIYIYISLLVIIYTFSMNKLKLILNTYFAAYLNMKDTIKLVNKLCNFLTITVGCDYLRPADVVVMQLRLDFEIRKLYNIKYMYNYYNKYN